MPANTHCRVRPLLQIIFAASAVLQVAIFSSAADRPNVILILTDDQGYGDMSCHGNPWLKTPNLDRLASESVSLQDYHVDPYCTPTRAALMTGRYCTRVGAWAVTQGRQLLRADEVTMADIFAASGYRTAMFGKWHIGDPFPFAPRFRGFRDVVCHRAGGVDEIGNPIGNDYFDDTYYRNGVAEHFTGYCTNVWFDEALRFIEEEHSHQPFFLYLPTNAMHSPFAVAEKYSARFAELGMPQERAKFFGMIENFDENLGRLLQSLREQDLERNTIVIFMGDNGTARGSSGLPGVDDGFNAGMRGAKGSVYEGGHRVACFVRWPEHLGAGTAVRQLTSHRDWLPTLIDWCELEVPRNVKFDGASLAPLLEGREMNWANRTMFIELQTDEVRPATLEDGSSQRVPFAVLRDKWRLVNGELYDIQGDPGQQRDVAAAYPSIVQELYHTYRAHYRDVFGGGDRPVCFPVGGAGNGTTWFTVRDWHPTIGHVIWEPDQLADDTLLVNGWWGVQPQQSGRYLVRLSRFPDDQLQPMNAKAARLKVGEVEMTKETTPVDADVEFELDLPAGRTKLQSWLTDACTGQERGAYFVQMSLIAADPAD